MHLLLTGRPGIGKTTLVTRVLAGLPGRRRSGFTTQELRDGSGRRQGFEIETLDGRRGLLAHVNLRSGPRVGRYRVDLPGFEALALPALAVDPAPDLIVIDEIGKMECFSCAFRDQVVRVLDSPIPLLATIALRGDPFIESLKVRPDVTLIGVTEADRDRLVGDLIGRLSAWPHSPAQ
jgi:nucleoside-triphosphatase